MTDASHKGLMEMLTANVMKNTKGLLFILGFLLVGSVFSTPIKARMVGASSQEGASDIQTFSENDDCDDDEDEDEDHSE